MDHIIMYTQTLPDAPWEKVGEYLHEAGYAVTDDGYESETHVGAELHILERSGEYYAVKRLTDIQGKKRIILKRLKGISKIITSWRDSQMAVHS